MKLYHLPLHTTILTSTTMALTPFLSTHHILHHHHHSTTPCNPLNPKHQYRVPESPLHSQSIPQTDESTSSSSTTNNSIPRTIETSIIMASDEIPPIITTKILRKAYPAIIHHLSQYGNPNIPLGSPEGAQCKSIRRMAFQNLLTEGEVELLDGLEFRWTPFEDVYEEADFDGCLERLVRYEEEFKTGYQIAKKYKPDPELGAWVTLIRRIGRDDISPDHSRKLDSINFAWVSTRKCGSGFMLTYQHLLTRLTSLRDSASPEEMEACWKEEHVVKWWKGVERSYRAGTLSEGRMLYLDGLPGGDWRERVVEVEVEEV